MLRRRTVLLVVMMAGLALGLGAVAGCGTEIGTPVPEEPSVFVLPDSGPGSLIDSQGDQLRLEGGGDALESGDFVIGTVDGGFLRRIQSVTVETDGSVTATTAQATLAEVVKNGTFTFTDGPPTAKSAPQAKEFVVFRIDQDLSRTIYSQSGVTLQTHGKFELDVNIDLDITISDHRLTYFASAINGTVYLDLTADFQATVARSFGTSGDGIPILSSPLRKYMWGLIGPVPVVIEVTANLYAGLTGETDAFAEFSTGFTAESEVSFGAEYSQGAGWSKIQEQGFVFNPTDPRWCLEGEIGAKVFIKPVIEIQLYSVTGPKFDIEPYLEFNANGDTCDQPGQNPTGTFAWDLAAGLAGHVKVKADILDIFVIESPSLTLFDLTWPLANDAGTVTPPSNNAPTVSAGPDRNITWPTDMVFLNAAVSDNDGPDSLSITWSRVSGPGSVVFGAVHAEDTTVTFGAAGVYVLRLEAFDGELFASDTVSVTVEGPINEAPLVDAGDDRTVIWRTSVVSVNGSASDDGLPAPASLLTTWALDSGPGGVTFGDIHSMATTVEFDSPGTHVLALTVFDGEKSGHDFVTIDSCVLDDPEIVSYLPDFYVSEPSENTLRCMMEAFNIELVDGPSADEKWDSYMPFTFNTSSADPTPHRIVNTLRVARVQQFAVPLPFADGDLFAYLHSMYSQGAIRLELECTGPGRAVARGGGGTMTFLEGTMSSWTRTYCYLPANATIFPPNLLLVAHESRHNEPDDPGHPSPTQDVSLAAEGGYGRGAIYAMWVYKYSLNDDADDRALWGRAAKSTLERAFVDSNSHPNPVVQAIVTELLTVDVVPTPTFGRIAGE